MPERFGMVPGKIYITTADGTTAFEGLKEACMVDGSQYGITEEDAKQDEKAYPAVNVRQEYLQMERWLNANPRNRKTRSGIRRFINSWLGRAQNSARPGQKQKAVSAQNYQQRDYSEEELLDVSDDLIAEARKQRVTA